MTVLPPTQVAKRTASLIGRLQASDEWAAALAGRTLDPTPALVQRLDREHDLYYIFTVRKDAKSVTARFAMSGEIGDLLEAEGIEDPHDALPPYQDPLVSLQSRVGEHASTTALDPALVGRHPVMVWKPCRESSSRLTPFWLLTIRDSLVYVRVDGQIFTKLTTRGKG